MLLHLVDLWPSGRCSVVVNCVPRDLWLDAFARRVGGRLGVGMAQVFVSHRRADAAEARRLAEDLRVAGHCVWLDEWAINIGDSIVGQIEEGLEGSTYLVLCYSDAGVMSPWISREWMSALARQLEGQGVRILPVMLTGKVAPAILADIHAADLRNDWDTGVNLLLRSIR
jgi:hypothetical protein